MSGVNVSGRPAAPAIRAWRVTTAARAFVVALVTGQVISSDSLNTLGITLFALIVLAAVLCAVEIESSPGVARWASIAEGIIAATILGTADSSSSVLLGYLALPPVIAGLRHGWVSTFNTALATGTSLVAGYLAANASGSLVPQLQVALPWLVAGLGTGLLASWLTRSVRAIEIAQAPYSAAHRLVTQLRDLSQRLPVELDSGAVADRLLREVVMATGSPRAVLCARQAHSGLHVIAELGIAANGDHETDLAARCVTSRRRERGSGIVALPVRIAEQAYGALVITGAADNSALRAVQSTLDEHALRLDTALVFEEVRTLATTEERSRLAREIHDGVAQEVASLGYLVDELAASATDSGTQQAAELLRGEITRVVNELRLSIFDLRHGLGESGSLAEALSDYVREVSRHSDLKVHLSLDEQHAWYSPKVSNELLRIGQEAIANVRKHSQARNLWVTLTTYSGGVLLEVADDGIGGTVARAGHYGLSTMRERAQSIQATLEVSGRPQGGTVVSIRTAARDATEGRVPI